MAWLVNKWTDQADSAQATASHSNATAAAATSTRVRALVFSIFWALARGFGGAVGCRSGGLFAGRCNGRPFARRSNRSPFAGWCSRRRAVAAAAVQHQVVVGHGKAGWRQRRQIARAAVHVKHLLAVLALEVVVVVQAGSFETRVVARQVDTAQRAFVHQ